jgi:hypothetical protein
MVQMQQGGRLQNDGRAEESCPANEKRAYASDEAIGGMQVGRSLAPAIQDEQLMPEEHGFG